MFVYAKIINEKTNQCDIGDGNDEYFYQSIGMTKMRVEQAYDGSWYLAGYAPVKPAPTKEEVDATRRQLYTTQVDPITAHINRLRDEEQTPEVIEKIERLKAERAEIVAKIKEENPYPAEENI